MVGGLLALVAGSPASAQESEVGRMFMRLAPEVQMEGLQLAVRDTENRCDRPLRHFYAGPGTQG
ncbi:MAG: hypothetical protein JWR59_2478, partial [Brevundimonas sp.]|nr:hypothetical protein [Brevundimonas sp.]